MSEGLRSRMSTDCDRGADIRRWRTPSPASAPDTVLCPESSAHALISLFAHTRRSACRGSGERGFITPAGKSMLWVLNHTALVLLTLATSLPLLRVPLRLVLESFAVPRDEAGLETDRSYFSELVLFSSAGVRVTVLDAVAPSHPGS